MEQVSHEVYNGQSKDAHNNVIDSWANPVPVTIIAFDPGGTSEPELPGQDRVVTTPRLILPPIAPWNHRDRVTVRGDRFEVDGDTLKFRNPHDAQNDCNVVNLKAVTG